MITKTTLDLLTGKIWQPRHERINQLRNDNQTIPNSPLSHLRQEIHIETKKTPVSSIQLVSIDKILPQVTQIPSIQPTMAAVTNTTQPKTTQLINNWQQLINEIQSCEACKLCNGRTHTVIERGSRNAKLMFIGEGPGEHEDLQGKPFVGNSGQLLDKMIIAMQFAPEDVYIANVVKCRPPKNRNPEHDEIAECSKYIKSQIALVKPLVIVALGRFAAQMLLDTELAIGKLRNQVHKYENINTIVTYHPSYLLRTPTAKKDAWQDLQLAMQTLGNTK